MDIVARQDSFYASVPVFHGFARLMDPALYVSLPDDWVVGIADIVQSTTAIAAKRYKTVNMAGAAIIAAVTNALDHREFPFVFGGDGASFAVPPGDLALARDAMAATAAWVRDDLGLVMRVALVPVADIRAKGFDVRVARFAPSPNVSYAMFSGGGLGWAEAAIKRGEFAIEPAPSGAVPDLSGLSCRFEEIPSARGIILSVVVVPVAGAEIAELRSVMESVVALIEKSPDAGRPVPADGPTLRWPAAGFDLETRATRRGPLLVRRAVVAAVTLFSYVIVRYRIPVGGFLPRKYLAELVANTDFRKYDDGLRMIVDCTEELAAELEGRLSAAAARGIVRYGLHRQDAAMMTCFTPALTRSDHLHFVDGARGGYASAMTALKTAFG
ncbi:DUF3095 domain-containing protein [Bradyrhizobium sp. LHD-71]|uniref:DUF3095 domain-containing protein n=1 Tax=Bradyrhizobium sp. LHD-71 TaxID=3072141 RepID=UPI00280CD6ED|nr:DUF3095 domain-containing protein [Bradyrhizobium sp. LHD-71]MDQ8728942.1 DUF3095 domain-containing protein [Bradyrhizobium sp. LHD-71]